MKISALLIAAAAALTPISAYADGPAKVGDFPLADRIKAKVASGKPLDIYVSYHDVSNEFAPAIKAGVAKGGAEDKVNAQFIGPVGADANAQINEIETLMGKMDGLAISSVSSDALGPVIDRVLKAGIPVVTYNTDNPEQQTARLRRAGSGAVRARGRQADGQVARRQRQGDDHDDRRRRAMVARPREGRARGACRPSPAFRWSRRSTPAPTRRRSIRRSRTPCSPIPSVTGILSLECCSTPAAGTWVQRNKKTGQIKVVGFDLLDQTVQLVQSGDVQATIDQAPGEAGF